MTLDQHAVWCSLNWRDLPLPPFAAMNGYRSRTSFSTRVFPFLVFWLFLSSVRNKYNKWTSWQRPTREMWWKVIRNCSMSWKTIAKQGNAVAENLSLNVPLLTRANCFQATTNEKFQFFSAVDYFRKNYFPFLRAKAILVWFQILFL